MEKHYLAYAELLEEVDNLCNKLEKMHHEHLACKAGCDLCCMDYSILPVEFFSIANNLKQRKIKLDLPKVNAGESCVFLVNHRCSIYSERPVICRTHGLPLLFMNENEEWELSACDLNFTTFDLADFTIENTFPQDRFNSKLFLLNQEFLKDYKENNFGDFDLIPLRELVQYIEKE